VTDARPSTRRRVLVQGRVQGVFFRQGCRREAERLGVSGWVRNLDDGRVEVVIEGDESRVAELVAWCRVGPSRALVTAVDVRTEPVEGLQGFVTR
jgi:acylphosphatase